jgi:hypothetical protein
MSMPNKPRIVSLMAAFAGLYDLHAHTQHTAHISMVLVLYFRVVAQHAHKTRHTSALITASDTCC